MNNRLLSILLLGTLCLPGFLTTVKAEETEQEYYELMQTFVETFEEIESNYVTEIDRKELMEAAIRGMLIKLDPYSNYISPEELTQFTESVEQEFGGVGIHVELDRASREIVIVSPIPGTPAYQAGIRSGDRIIKIEDQTVAEFEVQKEIETAVKLLKGKPGEKVQVTIRRAMTKEEQQEKEAHSEETEEAESDGSTQTLDIELTRAIIRVPTVLGDQYNKQGSWNFMLPGEEKIGYVRLTHFSRNTSEELRAAIEQLKKQGMKSLVMDLRNNPGGLLTSAVEICDMFIDSGKIVTTKGRNTREQVQRARRSTTLTDVPLSIIVNRFSASASEIVSACLQDHERAIVVGERSWGKGSVQNVIPVKDGKSALKLTTASYHRPSGKNIHRFPGAKPDEEWGVMPNDDYQVRFDREQMRNYARYRAMKDRPDKLDQLPEFTDTQLEKALHAIEEMSKAKELEDAKPEAKPAA